MAAAAAPNLVISLSYPVPVSAALTRSAVVCALLLLAGCASESTVRNYVPKIVTPYRMDIQQGNFVTQDMVDKLQAGQSRDQVRFILGTPLLVDVFHPDRWDYIFRFSKGWSEPEKHHLTLFFDKSEKLARWESDVPPPKSEAQIAEEKRGFFGNLFNRGGGTSPAVPVTTGPAPGAPVAAPAPPAPPGASVAGTANVSPASAEMAPSAPAASDTVSAAPAEAPGDKKPGLMTRMFGWMRGTGTAEAAAGASRAASPDPQPIPKPSIAEPPRVPANEPAPAAQPGAQLAPPGATASAVPETPVTVPAAPPASPPASVVAVAPPTASASVVANPPAAAPPVLAPLVASPVAAGTVAASPAPEPLVAQAAPAPVAATPAPAARPAASPEGVLAAIEKWRAAWQLKDVRSYLAAYAPDFRPAGNLSRARWEAQRRERLTKPTFIVVKVSDPQVTLGKDDVAVAVFVQEYESNALKESGRKTLKMGLYGNEWLIREEASNY